MGSQSPQQDNNLILRAWFSVNELASSWQPWGDLRSLLQVDFRPRFVQAGWSETGVERAIFAARDRNRSLPDLRADGIVRYKGTRQVPAKDPQ
jgi:hypothetical protein